jgi:hypothetical protein
MVSAPPLLTTVPLRYMRLSPHRQLTLRYVTFVRAVPPDDTNSPPFGIDQRAARGAAEGTLYEPATFYLLCRGSFAVAATRSLHREEAALMRLPQSFPHRGRGPGGPGGDLADG